MTTAADRATTRSAALDLFKTALVVGMIGAHVIQLTGRFLPDMADDYAEFINLVTFSGFVFALGLGMGLSSGTPKRRPFLARVLPAIRLLAAAYISTFAFILLVDETPLTPDLIWDVLTFSRLFGWSEFLASFFTMYLITAIARPVLVWVARNPITLILGCLGCLASTWWVNNDDLPLLATLIGTDNFASFPLLPYLPWLLVGIALGLNGGRINFWHAALALVVTAGTYYYGYQIDGPFKRFPPEIAWIIQPAAWLLLYYGISQLTCRFLPIPAWVTVPGRHVLSFLVVSNLAIFSIRYLYDHPIRHPASIVLLTGVLLLTLSLFWLAFEHFRKLARFTKSRVLNA